jgi:hypothetical protein
LRNEKKLQIVSVSALDLGLDVGYDDEGWERLDLWKEKSSLDLKVVLTIRIGHKNEKGTNDFSLVVCTKQHLKSNKENTMPQYMLVVEFFDWPLVKSKIISRIYQCDSDEWGLSVDELRKEFYWEYEKTSVSLLNVDPMDIGFSYIQNHGKSKKLN